MTQLRNDLIIITSNMADEPSKTMERLETYIQQREDDAVKLYILANGSPRALPETTSERMEEDLLS